ncbi:MAG: ribonuclease III [Rhodobacteraceae bacterium]|nr:MAG: ribonuclease III [Paracoccaceae bacterium]
MARPPALARLFDRLGRAVDPELMEAALTHPSAGSPARPDYERLEFLGDRVLMLVIAEALLERWPDAREGDLAPRLNALVRKETCAEIAAEIGVGEHLRLDRSEARTGGRTRLSILGDAMEAVIAAVYLDKGLEAARAVVLRHWGPRMAAQGAVAPRDAKTALQEWAQARGMAPPAYVTVGREGPDHAPTFTVEARLADGRLGVATAGAKRAAEQAAAAALLERIEDDPDA